MPKFHSISMQIPKKLKQLENVSTGKTWLLKLPQLIDELCNKWNLELEAPYADSNISYVAPARQNNQPVVLKIQWPHEECEFEADALKFWNGNGAIKLLAHDRDKNALLLERCSPGTHLSKHLGSQLDVLIDLLPRLWVPIEAPFKSLFLEAEGWAANLYENWEKAGKPCEQELVDAASQYLKKLPNSQGKQVLVHQDLHGDNILAAEREPWLVIDPKPLVGEREFSLAPIIRSFEFGHSYEEVIERLNRLTNELGLNRERARGWCIAQTIAWSIGSSCADKQYETVRWLLEAG